MNLRHHLPEGHPNREFEFEVFSELNVSIGWVTVSDDRTSWVAMTASGEVVGICKSKEDAARVVSYLAPDVPESEGTERRMNRLMITSENLTSFDISFDGDDYQLRRIGHANGGWFLDCRAGTPIVSHHVATNKAEWRGALKLALQTICGPGAREQRGREIMKAAVTQR